MKLNINYLIIFMLSFSIMSCIKVFDEQPGDNEQASYDNLDFSNITNQKFSFTIQTEDGEPITGLPLKFWDKSPVDGGNAILKVVTDDNGAISTFSNLPSMTTEVILEIGYLGLPNFLIVPIEKLGNEIIIKGTTHDLQPLSSELVPNQSNENSYIPSSGNGRINAETILQPLGSFDSLGKPDYLLDRDAISANLLEYINTSLPENKPVPIYHPDYLEDAETNLNITETADVYMTFVTEGAGYRNVVGYYKYPTGQPPSSQEEIDSLFIGFPNFSMGGYGGSLRAGDKIHLGRFEPGTTIGFVLLADGFDPYISQVKDYAWRYYSNSEINREEENKQHTVTLWDETHELFLIGFEDLFRDHSSSDDDFNDAVFYVSSNPVEAISRTNIMPVDKPGDTDLDGVNDVYDEFPEDPSYAYKSVYPGEEIFGTFAFEDMWPQFGDYDFNDLVIDYQYTTYGNASNKVGKFESKFVIKAIGASFQNGFGFVTDLEPGQVESVTGNRLVGNMITTNSNGTEADQSKATIIVSDKLHSGFPTTGIINTMESSGYLTPDTISVVITLNEALSSSQIGYAPFNPFLIINQDRGREVHLPGYAPSDLVNTDYFGTGNDNSSAETGVYYRAKDELPWAMNLPVSFDYPKEGNDIRNSYLYFNQWARSFGFSYMDWYIDKEGFRDRSRIYPK